MQRVSIDILIWYNDMIGWYDKGYTGAYICDYTYTDAKGKYWYIDMI